ncbi:hypothetical protein ACFX12_033717 [Malus domestica]
MDRRPAAIQESLISHPGIPYGRRSLNNSQVMRFTFDGNRVREDQTPEQREMEDDATDVFSDQLGGHALKFN